MVNKANPIFWINLWRLLDLWEHGYQNDGDYGVATPIGFVVKILDQVKVMPPDLNTGMCNHSNGTSTIPVGQEHLGVNNTRLLFDA